MTLHPAEPLDPTFAVELPPAPYPGMRPFNTEEWPVFFGREEMTDEVIRRVIRQHLVVVHGDSGCGKSSLIRAGVLAQLEQERARSGVRWRTGHMLPREAPLQNLARALAELQGRADDPDSIHEIRRMLNHGADAPAALAERLRRDDDDNICILVDQFEELFSFARKHGREEAQLFVEVLVGLQAKPPPGLYAVLTMRSEFLGACARFRGLAEAVNATQYLLPRMERPDLMRAIREPAALYDGQVSQELAERLIAETGGEQDQLPLIQHGLMLLWRRKIGAPTGLAEAAASPQLAEAVQPFHYDRPRAWRLELRDYREAGSLAALLSGHADEVMAVAAPDPERRKVVEHLFRALTDTNAEGNAVRRPQKLRELAAATGVGEDALVPMIDHFRAEGVSFLTPYGSAPMDAETLIDISHEALIRCWREIADEKEGWLQREFRDGLIWKSLRVQAQKGETLSAAATADREAWLQTLPSSEWSERYEGGWAIVQALLDASRKARDQEARNRRELEEAKRREAEERAQRAEDATRAAAELAARQQELREAQEQIADEQRQRAEAEQERAAEAYARAREADASRRRFKLMAIWAAVLALVSLVTAGYALWSRQQAEQALVQAERAEARAEAARLQGQRGDSLYRAEQARSQLAAGSSVTAMLLALAGLSQSPIGAPTRPWVAETGGALVEILNQRLRSPILRGHEDWVVKAAFSPDDARIVSGSADGTVRLWDVATGRELLVLRGHDAEVWATAFSPDGTRLASGSWDDTVRVWDAATGEEQFVLSGHQGSLWAATFSPDGRRILSASDDKTLRIWDVASGAELMVLNDSGGPTYAAAFSPDGKRIVSGSDDRTVRVWDANSGKELLAMRGHEGPVLSTAFSPDGVRIVSGSSDGTLRIWNAANGKQLSMLIDHAGNVVNVDFSPDGARVVSGSADRSVRVWDTVTGEQLLVLRVHDGPVYGVGFSSDGARIVSTASDRTARVTWIGRNKQELIETARAQLSRELTPEERRRFYLTTQ